MKTSEITSSLQASFLSVANNIFEMFFRLMAFYKIQKLR